MATRSCLYAFLLLVAFQFTIIKATTVRLPPQCRPVVASDLAKIEFLTNLLIFKAELFLQASTGDGINDVIPGFVQGPLPVGARVANLDGATQRIIQEQGLGTCGQIRAIEEDTLLNAPIQRAQLDLRPEAFTPILNVPASTIYGTTSGFLIVANFVNSILVQYLAEITPSIAGTVQEQLVAGIALKVAADYGVTRAQLNAAMIESTVLLPSNVTVANLTNSGVDRINQLGGCGLKNEALVVPLQLGAENRTTSNLVPADVNSLVFSRTEREVLRIVFGTGDATVPGGVFPAGFIGSLFRVIQALRLS